MDSTTFREFGKAAIDFIADYLENIRDCNILPSVSPGYLFELLPRQLPEKPEQWKNILEDITKFIEPGITHWQSPNMHAFYPTACSYPAILGEMLAAGYGIMGFNWLCSPACTELEVIVMDWLAKFLKLPNIFLHESEGPGGGVIQGSASEAVLVAVIAAREQMVRHMQIIRDDLTESEIRGKLIAYSSDQSNSCIEKAGLLSALPIRLLQTSSDLTLNGDMLKSAVEEDLAKGLIPVICIATLGTTGTCAYDDIASLATVCQKFNIWLHVDAAYAGAAFALDEYAHLRLGLEEVDSLNFNLHKFLMVNFDCTAMWIKDANKIVESFNVNRIYLNHRYEGQTQIPDFRHWQIPLGRRFRSLKVWITFRSIGSEGLKTHIRKHIKLAKQFESYVRADPRFEIVSQPTLGLVCFRVQGDNKYTTTLLQHITERKKIYMVQGAHCGQHFLRFVVCGMNPEEKDIDFAWEEIQMQLSQILQDELCKTQENSTIVKHEVGVIGKKLASDLNLMSNAHNGKYK